VHRKHILIYIQQAATLHSLFYLETALSVSRGGTTVYFIWKLLYVFRVVVPTKTRREVSR